MALEIILVTFFVVNIGIECWDIVELVLSSKSLDYFLDPFNFLDWIHFTFMGLTIGWWFRMINLVSAIQMKTSYNILLDPTSSMRPFLTNAAEEHAYLHFQDQIKDISQKLTTYTTFAGISSTLFVFRQLKSLDFQERIGLVTRTLTAASSELLHFFILFGLVFFGYAVVGTMLFGHQSELMSTLSQSCMTLLILLLNFDTTKFFASFVHASEEWVVMLYVWTYVLICFFILLNIFLAILVDAYAEVKMQTENAGGLGHDVLQIFNHQIKRVMEPTHMFMSNQRALVLLEQLKSELETTIRKSEEIELNQGKLPTTFLKINKKLRQKTVLVPGGANIMPVHIAKMLHRVSAHASEVGVASGTVGEDGISDKEMQEAEMKSPRAHSIVHRLEGSRLVWDFMKRFGETLQERQEQRTSEISELMALDTAKRQIAAMLQIGDLKRMVRGNEQPRDLRSPGEYQGVLSVTVVEAQDLPSMDVIRGCDAYCILSIENQPHRVFETEIVMRSLNPSWNEEFLWEINELTPMLDIAVVDYDRATSHDIVGNIHIDIQRLRPGQESDEWYDVILSNRREKKWGHESSKRTCLRIKCLRADRIETDASLGLPVSPPYPESTLTSIIQTITCTCHW